MPWSLTEDGIVSDPNGVSWTEAVTQKRSLRAQESRVAAMYTALDSETEEYVEPEIEVVQEVKSSSELVKIEIGKENEALTASLLDRMEQMDLRAAETQSALVAALHAIGTRSPVVNVEAPAAPNVTVEAPPAAEVTVNVPEQPTPEVHFNPEITVQHPEPRTKTVTFERDPLTGQVSKAEVDET